MRLRAIAALVTIVATVYGADKKEKKPASTTKKADPKKFGKNIEWLIDYSEAAKVSHEQNKPIFLLIWRTWCNACHSLSKQMSNSFDIEKLSKQFVMLSIWDEENEPYFDDFSAKPHVTPHVPRVHFITPDGKLMKNIKCDDPSLEEDFTFYYSQAETIVQAMEEVIKQSPKTRERKADKKEEKGDNDKKAKKETSDTKDKKKKAEDKNADKKDDSEKKKKSEKADKNQKDEKKDKAEKKEKSTTEKESKSKKEKQENKTDKKQNADEGKKSEKKKESKDKDKKSKKKDKKDEL